MPEPTRFFDYDASAPLRVEEGDAPVVDGVPFRELSYDDSSGGRLVASLGPVGDGPAVVIAHGGSADGRHWFRPEAAELTRAGLTVLLTAVSLPEHGHPPREAIGGVAAQRVLADEAGRQRERQVRARCPRRERRAVERAEAERQHALGLPPHLGDAEVHHAAAAEAVSGAGTRAISARNARR